jgi:ribokinase
VNDPRRGLDALSGQRAGVLVLGSVNLDLVLRAERLPRPGETIAGAEISGGLGGKGANQAIAAARMGSGVALIARVGDDPSGRVALQVLRSEDIATDGCRFDSEPTGRAAVFVDHAGENMIVVGPGANATLVAADVAAAVWPPDVRVLLTQLEIPAEVAAAGIALAREREVTSCLNATPATALDHVGEVPDVLIVNRVEAQQLLCAPSSESRSAAELAVAVARARGIATVVVTDGGRGAAAAIDGGAGETVSASAPEVQVVDTTGAGDAFAGVFAACLAEDLPLSVALRRGCAAGALACTVIGAFRSLPRRDAVVSAASR